MNTNKIETLEKMPLVSIIVPVYRVEKYLRQCIESLINQTYKNIEIILVDDGSPDSCGRICDEYAQKDKRVIVIHQKNGGPQKARAIGVNCARGIYITFVDGDDYVQENMCQDIYKELLRREADIIITGSTHLGFDGVKLYREKIASGYYEKEQLIDVVHRTMMAHGKSFQRDISPSLWSKWFKKEILQQVFPRIDSRITVAQDVPCTYFSILLANSVLVCENMYHYQYRYNIESGSRRYKSNWAENVEYLCEQLDEIYSWGDYCYLKDSFALEKFWAFYSKANREFQFSGKKLSEKIATMKKAVCYIAIQSALHEVKLNETTLSIGKKIEFYLLRRKKVFLAYLVWKLCYMYGRLKGSKNEGGRL